MVPSILINESDCQMRSRLTEKCAKSRKMHVHHTSYMPGNTRRKANRYTSKNGMTKYYSVQRIFRLIQGWWTTRQDIIRISQRGSLVWLDCFFLYYLWLQKNEKTQSGHTRLCARVAMEEGLLSVWVGQSIGQSQSVDEYCYLLNLGFASLNS